MGRLTFILGGVRSGKSSYAMELAERRGGSVAFIATAEALDEEMKQRIIQHQAERSKSWRTMEIPHNLAQYLEGNIIEEDCVILDCLTLLVSNIVTLHSKDTDNPPVKTLFNIGISEGKRILTMINNGQSDWIVVSNEVGLGLVPPYPMGRVYRDLLGELNKLIAKEADEVFFMLAGIPMRLEK